MTAYLDHAATTPLRPEASAAMLPWLTEQFGNPSGVHVVARRARTAIDDARDVMAEALGCKPGEIVFTGGGTEADNLAVLGSHARAGGTVICSAIEHHAVLHACEATSAARVVPVTADGLIDLDAFADALDEDVTIVSVMLVNNEVGTVQPLDRVAALMAERAPRAVLHTDAVQALAWLDVATLAAPASLIALSAHKFGGPQGVGVLVAREGTALSPLIHGGGQERERRSGTHNVAGIVGMAAAASAAVRDRDTAVPALGARRDRLRAGLLNAIEGALETAPAAPKIAGNCHVRLRGVESEALLLLLDDDGVCASAGSACASGAIEPSHVLTAMGIPRDEALGSLRLSLGWTTTDADVDLALKSIPNAVARLRENA